MMPAAVLQGDGEDVHDRVVERLPAGLRVHLLRVVGAGADDVVGVVAGVQTMIFSIASWSPILPHALEGEVDQRLALVLGRMLLGVGVEDGALGLALLRQRHFDVGGAWPGPAGQQPGDETILALIDRRRGAFAPHRPVDRFDGHLAGEGGA
jgi:hypothetical protein